MNLNTSLAESQTVLQRSSGVGRISVVCLDNQTRLKHLYQEGCAKIRLPRTYLGTGVEAVLINTAGGMTGGDRLDWNIELGPETQLTLTTQACEKLYKSSGQTALTNISICAGHGARVAWLPQELIVFDRSKFSRTICADLAEGCEGLFVEPMILGRHSMGEILTVASLHDRWRIRQAGRLVYAEDFRIGGDVSALLAKAAVTGGKGALATVLLVSPRAEDLLANARRIIGNDGGASFWNGHLLARLVADDGYGLREKLMPLVSLLNGDIPLPRTWSL